jgi:hypothetical protein
VTTLANLLTAGDTLAFTTSVPDYPASAGWVLKYRLAPRVSGSAIDITATADGDDHAVQVAASATALWIAGHYTWSAYVELLTERYTVDRGDLEIRAASASMAAGTDGRSHARIVLDAIEATIEGRASKDQQEYTIGNRSLKRTPMADLLRLKSVYMGYVANENAADRLNAGLPAGGKLQVRF